MHAGMMKAVIQSGSVTFSEAPMISSLLIVVIVGSAMLYVITVRM